MKLQTPAAFRFVALLLSLAVSLGAWAQQITVTGTVTDTEGGPLIGATVLAGDSGHGASVDLDGNYTIKTNPQGTLTFSYVGYEPVTVQVDGRNTIDVSMHPTAATALDELVVVGYGSMKKNDLTGAVGSMSGKDIKDVPVNNIGSAMQGRLAGVNIIDSPVPGDNVNIKIRGLGSINNCDPLLVIDGVPTDLPLNALNAQDVERIDVLKDASATAIYGSRGANGVVLVTTRRGAAGTSHLNVSVNLAWQNAAKTMRTLDSREYMALNNDMLSQAGRPTNPLWTDPSTVAGPDTDWVDELLHTGFMQNYNVSYSGGTDKAHWYLSGGFLDQSGIVQGVNYRRFTLQSNNDAQVLRWLKFSNNLLFSADTKKRGSYSMVDAMHALPLFAVRDNNGEWTGPDGNADWYGSVRNPVGNNKMYRTTTHGYNLLANVTGEITFCPYLKFRSVFGFDGKFWFEDGFSPAYPWKPIPVEESTYREVSNRSFTYLSDNYFTYDQTFGRHSVNAMLGTSTQWNDFHWLSGTMADFLFDKYHQMNNGQTMKDISGTRTQWALVSVMARANYSFDDRYFLTATVRHDGSSRFGRDHRWGTFPSVSAAWRISKEAFFPEDKAVSDLKLRLGYGQTGSQASASEYGYLSLYNTLVYPFGTLDKDQPALIAQTLANPDLHWETIEQYNAGVDLSLVNNRVNISLDGYIKNTRDMLVKAAIPITSGFEDTFTTLTNAGRMRNIGWELQVSSLNITGGDWEWETSLVLTYNRNKIKFLNSDVPFYGNQLNGSYVTMQAVNYPRNVFYGYVTDGIFQTQDEIDRHAIQPGAEPGDIRFRDLNNDGVINDKDRTVLGNPAPAWLYSMNNRIAWRGLELQIYLQGAGGNKIYNYARINMESMSSAQNQYRSTLDRWTAPGTSDRMPRAVYGDPNNNTRVSDRWIENGSYLRLKNITLSYTFPRRWLSRLGVENTRVSFSCENVATITGYKGFDPEVGESGIDFSTFPQARTYNFSLSFNF